MRKVLAFLVWLFSFWPPKDFFLRWLRRRPLYPASGESAGLEQLASQEGLPESELARFLSSLPEDERWCRLLVLDGDSIVKLCFGLYGEPYRLDMPAGYREFLGAVASSEIVFREVVQVFLLWDDSFKHMEALADALRQSGNAFRELDLKVMCVSAIPLAKCVSRALLGNDGIQAFHLSVRGFRGKMGKGLAAEFMSIVGVPRILRILKSLDFRNRDLDSGGMEQLMKPLNSPDSVLERLEIHNPGFLTQQLKHISRLLAASTSLKVLYLELHSEVLEEPTNEYTNIASALCSNRSLQVLRCRINFSTELKALLDPFIPRTNNLQPNTTLTRLELTGFIIGPGGLKP